MDDVEETYTRSVAARPIDWVIVGLDFARNVAEGGARGIGVAEMVLIGHANHQNDRRVFEDEARRQIETITNGE